MAQTVRDVMTADPIVLDATTNLTEASGTMRDGDIGAVLVQRDGALCGIVTDRDVVVRAVAEGRDPASTRLGDICSRELTTVTASDTAQNAARVMREKAVRRLPVVEDGGKPVGIVSLGDLAIERDRASALADISAAPGNT